MIPLLFIVGMGNFGFPLPPYGQTQRLVDSHIIQSIDKLFRIFPIIIMDDFYHSCIGRNFKNFSCTDGSIPSLFGVTNFVLSEKGKFTIRCGDGRIFINHLILQGCNHGHQLKSGAWLMGLSHRIIELLEISI